MNNKLISLKIIKPLQYFHTYTPIV